MMSYIAAVVNQCCTTANKRKNLLVIYSNSCSQNTANDYVCRYMIWDGSTLFENYTA